MALKEVFSSDLHWPAEPTQENGARVVTHAEGSVVLVVARVCVPITHKKNHRFHKYFSPTAS